MKNPEFNRLPRSISRMMLVALLYFPAAGARSQTLNQYQNIYNGGMSARTLAGYSEWQSFTAGLTGTLCQINMGFFNYVNGSGTLKIFSGTGTGGTLRQTKAVSVFCASGNCMIAFTVSVPVIAGQVYTFQFIPGSGIPDPYGVQVQVPGTYPGGQMAIIDPSGTYPLTFDMVFQTFVNTTPLPVELISFTGVNDYNVHLLEWTTATESNNDFFDMERSSDALSFEKIGRVKGFGNSNQPVRYSFSDRYPVPGENYYRLKQTDLNGAFSYSQIIRVTAGQNQEGLFVFPVPASKELNCRFLSHTGVPVEISITDVSGKTTNHISLHDTKEVNSITFDISLLSPGIYFIETNNPQLPYRTKFVKL